MRRALGAEWCKRMELVRSPVQRTLRVQAGRLTEAELDDMRARDALEGEAPPLSARAATSAWRQAHADRAALLREVEAARSPQVSGIFSTGEEDEPVAP